MKVEKNEVISRLTRRELGIIKLIAEGQNSKHIADILGISLATVQSHRENIISKIGIEGRSSTKLTVWTHAHRHFFI